MTSRGLFKPENAKWERRIKKRVGEGDEGALFSVRSSRESVRWLGGLRGGTGGGGESARCAGGGRSAECDTAAGAREQSTLGEPAATSPSGESVGLATETGEDEANWWALLALLLVLATAAGNILVCLAIAWERRLHNVTNYFLLSLAITDLMVAVLVMPLGILALVRGRFPLSSAWCLAWVCLDVLFCTASIMHLCTISVDRFLSLRYPMRFGRNKTRRRVTLKILFVWLLSIAMSLPLSLMYSKDRESVLKEGTCQIPDPLYKLVGSIVCFYIPLVVMLVTYALTVHLLHVQRKQLGGCEDVCTERSTWLSGQPSPVSTRTTHLIHGDAGARRWRRGREPITTVNTKSICSSMVATPGKTPVGIVCGNNTVSTTTTDTEEVAELGLLTPGAEQYPGNVSPSHIPTWDDEEGSSPEPMPTLHRFGEEMLKLSRGLQLVGVGQSAAPPSERPPAYKMSVQWPRPDSGASIDTYSTLASPSSCAKAKDKIEEDGGERKPVEGLRINRKQKPKKPDDDGAKGGERKEEDAARSSEGWQRGDNDISPCRCGRPRLPCTEEEPPWRSAVAETKNDPPVTRGYSIRWTRGTRVQWRRTRGGGRRAAWSRHGRFLRLEQKATKVLGVVFFTFVILWAPFFVLNLVPVLCPKCESHLSKEVMDLVTWLGYASSMVNPVFYTIFNKVFRQAFKKVLLCRYKRRRIR